MVPEPEPDRSQPAHHDVNGVREQPPPPSSCRCPSRPAAA